MKQLPKPRASDFSWRRAGIIIVRWLFFLGSVLFLIHFAQEITQKSGFHGLPSVASLVTTALAAFIISLASFTAALGWNLLLSGLSSSVSLTQAAAVYCSTQIAKYLPGNVGHYVGRVALAKTRLDIPTVTAILSLLQETGLACVGALLVGLFCYFLFTDQTLYGLGRTGAYALFAFILAAFVSVSALADMLRKSTGSRSFILEKSLRTIPALKTSVRAIPLYIAGYACIGIAVSVIGAGLMKMQLQDFTLITGAYSLAWIIGFVIPGAPGGLGVRESAFVLLLAGAYPKDAVLMLALLARLASVGADLLTFSVGLLLLRADTFRKLSTKRFP